MLLIIDYIAIHLMGAMKIYTPQYAWPFRI